MSFTPFGNLQNPFYQCGEDYFDVSSGVIQSDTVLTGVGWIVPFPKRAGWIVSFGAGVVGSTDDETARKSARQLSLLGRADFAACDLVATRHTPYLIELVAGTRHGRLVQTYRLGARDLLVAHVRLEGAIDGARPVVLVRAWRPNGAISVGTTRETDGGFTVRFERERDERYKTPPVLFRVGGSEPIAAQSLEDLRRCVDSRTYAPATDAGRRESPAIGDGVHGSEIFVASILDGGTSGDATNGEAHAGRPAASRVPPQTPAEATLALLTHETDEGASSSSRSPATGRTAVRDGSTVYGRSAEERAAELESAMPRLTGDFPTDMKNGFAYDFETTRLCTLPPIGVFSGPWPTWMSSMPRVVLAEGSLDMARLGYMDDRTARDAVLTVFRDTPGPNVPCIFASGEYNMVASDGTTCGTSPAWCVPLFNIYDLYLRTLDRDWIDALFPHLEDLVDYWLTERTDEEGWLTYKCTWEAGEDNNPRIDPLATGDNVISGYVRPVELQAAMAHAGLIMERFAAVIGREEQAARFGRMHTEYTERTRRLWDDDAKRFRDWDKTSDRFVGVAGKEDYWGADFTRQSPLSLVALLFDTATEEQRASMRDELRRFHRSPFTIWPSWATYVLEAASSIGMTSIAGEMAYDIARHVYAATDRRTIGEYVRPLPGASPEYWPKNWGEFGGNDAYAWGAQGASFLIRHLLGIRPAESDTGIGLRLSPSLPSGLRVFGNTFGVENLLHRGRRISIRYDLVRGDELRCTAELPDRRTFAIRNHASVTLR